MTDFMNLGRENETTVFYEGLGRLDDGIRSLSAILNTCRHGTVFLGVNNKGDVIGLDFDDDVLESIRELVHRLIKPYVIPNVEEHVTGDGKRFISMSATGVSIPYSFDGRYYIRNVSSDESAEPETVVKLVLSRGIDPLKEQTSDVQDLTFDLLFASMVSRNMHPRNDTTFFRSHMMMDEHDRFNLTAYLLSDQNIVPMQVVRFNGLDRTAMSSRMNFGNQSLIGSMKDILNHVSSYMVTKVDLFKGERLEVDLFDMESFREAWFNACVHNSWREMVPPSVLIFDDRLEVISYGTVPFPLSLGDFYNGDSRPVNSGLFSICSALGLMEQSGHGVPVIVKRYGREAFDITENGMKVTIPFAFEPEFSASRKETLINGLDVDERERQVLSYLYRNPEAKLSDVSEKTGFSLSAVKKTVSELKERGILRNDGTNRNSVWTIVVKGDGSS